MAQGIIFRDPRPPTKAPRCAHASPGTPSLAWLATGSRQRPVRYRSTAGVCHGLGHLRQPDERQRTRRHHPASRKTATPCTATSPRNGRNGIYRGRHPLVGNTRLAAFAYQASVSAGTLDAGGADDDSDRTGSRRWAQPRPTRCREAVRGACASSRAGAQGLAADALARGSGGRRVMSRLSPPHRAFHRAGVAGHAAPAPPGKAPVCRQSARKRFRLRDKWALCCSRRSEPIRRYSGSLTRRGPRQRPRRPLEIRHGAPPHQARR